MEDFFQPSVVEAKLKISFKQKELLQLAFTHRSFWNENKEKVAGHNERLEFLGDSVLGLLVADYLFQNYPHLDEGALSSLRAQAVDAPACASYIQKLDVAPFLLLGRGEQLNRGKGRDSIMADLFEAIMGALYLDQGLAANRQFLFAHFQHELDSMVAKPQRNWKAELQDYTQKNFQETPEYRLLEETGPAHAKIFRVGVWIRGERLGEGAGSSKKEAQVLAAERAIEKIEEKDGR